MFNFQVVPARRFSQPALPAAANALSTQRRLSKAFTRTLSLLSGQQTIISAAPQEHSPSWGTETTVSFLIWHQISKLHPILNPYSLNKYKHTWRNYEVGSQMVLFKNNLELNIINALASLGKAVSGCFKNECDNGLISLLCS